jgi:hypothetical protein
MNRISYLIPVSLTLIIFLGCTSAQTRCKAVLFPYIEYSHRAETQFVSGIDARLEISRYVKFHTLNIEVPDTWQVDTPLDTLHLFSADKTRSIVITFNRSFQTNTADLESIKIIGCDSFFNPHEEKTGKDFFRDLYLFTIDDLASIEDATLWQLYILWTKGDTLRNSLRLVHYVGDHLEAFRRDTDTTRSVKTTITLFHKDSEPDYFVIAGTFHDNAFFDRFVAMINELNP